jgi:hypothetical protein
MVALAVTVRIELPDMVTVSGFGVAVRPSGAVAVKATVPPKPPIEVTLIEVELLEL